MSSLWPEDFGKGDRNPPVAILREQADHLTKQTKGVIVATVQTGRDGDNFVHQFVLRAPYLDNYRYHLLSVSHALGLYPVDVVFHTTPQNWQSIPDEARLLGVLKEIFQSGATRNIVQALLSQSDAVQ
jgi:hypothetical protein